MQCLPGTHSRGLGRSLRGPGPAAGPSRQARITLGICSPVNTKGRTWRYGHLAIFRLAEDRTGVTRCRSPPTLPTADTPTTEAATQVCKVSEAPLPV